MVAALLTGHTALADWLLLIAVVLFALDALVRLAHRPDATGGALIPAGLALVAFALLAL